MGHFDMERDYMRALFCLTIAITLAGASCGSHTDSSTREAWNPQNDPLNLGSGFEYQFAGMPATGTSTVTPWSDTYWPTNRGGIMARWRDASSDAFTYTPPTFAELQLMTPYQISLLSPA